MLETVGELVRGEIGVVRGSYFINGCQDTMTCTEWLGCSRCRHDEPRPQPFGDLELRLMQDGSVWDLGVAEGHDGSPVWSMRVPEGAEPGAARLLVDQAEPLEIRIR